MEGKRFEGQEYLGLYPYLTYSQIKDSDKYDFWVYEQETEKYVKLRSWLDGKNPFYH